MNILENLRPKKKEKDEILELKHLYRSEVLKRKKALKPKLRLESYLQKAGISIHASIVKKALFDICVVLNLMASFYLIYRFSTDMKVGVERVALAIAFIWAVIFAGMLFLLWLLLYVVIDLRIFKRKVEVEEVLPDFLQLTSANIRAGMPIDQALWYAVRPRFGVLASEIEIVAKETMSGEDLQVALLRFSGKYDSEVLKRSISLLIEGLEAGGEVGELLNNIASNIQENQLLRKEMSANVKTYAIFISFASIAVAPLLFALSEQLLIVVTTIMGKIDTTGVDLPGSIISLSAVGITAGDFRIFAVLSLLATSLFSAMIVATITKGDVRSGVNYIPAFAFVSIGLFFAASTIMKVFFHGMF